MQEPVTIFRGFTDAAAPMSEHNHCDVCMSTENIRWFGNTNKIVCSNPRCYEEMAKQYESQQFHGVDDDAV